MLNCTVNSKKTYIAEPKEENIWERQITKSFKAMAFFMAVKVYMLF